LPHLDRELLSLLGRAWISCRTDGLARTLSRSAHRVWHTTQLVVYSKRVEQTRAPDAYPDVLFRLLRREELEWLVPRMPHMGRKARAILKQQFQPGDRVLIGTSPEDAGRVIFHLWLSRRDPVIQLLDGCTRPRHATLRRLWVPKSHRRRHIAQRGFAFGERIAAADGIEDTSASVVASNRAARRLHEKLGYEHCADVRLVTRWDKESALVRTPGDPRWTRKEIPWPT